MKEALEPTEREQEAADLLYRWADAIRGDWSSVDGRTCRDQLDRIAAYLMGTRPKPSFEDVGLCPRGGGHWPEHCLMYGCREGA